MGDRKITWTPTGESGTDTLNLTQLGIVNAFEGFTVPSGDIAFTIGGESFSQMWDQYFKYKLKMRAISRELNPSAGVYPWGRVSQFVAHANHGGVFTFAMDDDNDVDDTLAAAASRGDQQFEISDTTDLAAGDWVYIEYYGNPMRFQISKIDSVDSGVLFTIHDDAVYSYPINSIVRHWEFFPSCVFTKRADFRERSAGQGSHLWDLTMQFRTVRNS